MAKPEFEHPVRVALHAPGYARFRIQGLRPDRYAEYRLAAEGTRYVREHRATLTPLDKVPAILGRLRDADFDVEMEPKLIRVLQEQTAQQWIDLKSAQERIARIDDEMFRLTGCRLFPFQRTGALWLTLKSGAILADDMGLGKLQSVDEPVLTPDGWRRIGDLVVGDSVIGANGKPTQVTGVFPQGKQRQYRVEMSDGAWCKAGAEHLWLVHDATRGRRGRVMTTAQLMEEGLRSKPSPGRRDGAPRWFVPVVKPVAFSRKKLPLDPYLAGALTTNGALAVTFHGPSDQRRLVMKAMPLGSWVEAQDETSATLHFNRSSLKYMPVVPEYMLGSIQQRLALLQGLMDNGGRVLEDGMTCEYITTVPRLAADVLEIVRSLGGVAWMDKRIPRFTLPAKLVPFRLPRKLKRYKPPTKYQPTHAIASITPLGVEESVCIAVEAPDHLYVTRDHIVTHNTVQCLTALPQNVPVLVVAPAVAKGVWRGETRRWRPRIRTVTLVGRDSFRWPEPGEELITNYEILPKIHDEDGVTGRRCTGTLPPEPCPGCAESIAFAGPMVTRIRTGHLTECTGFLEPRECPGCHPFLKLAPPDMVLIADEAHYLKGARTNRTMRFRAISEAVRSKGGRVWLMTGTPLENEPKDLWAVFKAAGIAEEAFGSWDQFVDLFKGRKLHYGGYDWGDPDDDVKERLQRVMLRRRKVDVMPELPVKVWREHDVELDARTIRSLDTLIRETGKTVGQIVDLLEKEEISFDIMSAVRAALAFAKIPAMTAIVKDFEEQNDGRGEPLVVFSAHRAPIDTLAKRPGWAVITGDVSPDKRKEIEERFQRGELRGVGLTIRAGGVSITLTRACNVLFVDQDFKPTANAQAEDRIVRIGQTRGCVVTVLVANHPLDVRVAEILTKKTKMISDSVDAAAVDDDAPDGAALGRESAKEFEAALHKIQKEIACGRAVRRMAETEEEEEAIEKLHTIVFASRSDERVAHEFMADMADGNAIGLSNAQWQYAVKIVQRGRQPETQAQAQAQRQPSERPAAPPKQESAPPPPPPPPVAAPPASSDTRIASTARGGWAERKERRARRQGGR